MAQVCLTPVELEHDILLPGVCMFCGSPANEKVPKTFSWYPPALAILIALLGVIALSGLAVHPGGKLAKQTILQAPMCARHKNHWKWRRQVIAWTLVGVIVLMIGVLPLGKITGERVLWGYLCPGIVICQIAWCFLTMILLGTSIRVKNFNNAGLTLAGVSSRFVQSLQEFRDQLDREEEESRGPA